MTSDDAPPLRFATDVGVRLTVALVVWGLFGWLVDLVAATAPWGRFAGLLIGSTVGLVLVARRFEGPGDDAPHDDGDPVEAHP